ncbi:MAG: alpha-2-macroglobulin family protein [Minisyncoccia bacterium]
MVYERTYITVTSLGIVEKKVEVSDSNYGNGNLTDKQKGDLKNVYWITDLKSLSPIEGAKVQLFSDVDDAGLKKEGAFQTDASGVAETGVIDDLSGAIVTKGADSAVISGTGYYDKFQYGSTARQSQKIYLYTDKPIYKPGQDVNIKGLYRIGYDGNYEIFKDEKVPLKIYNSKGEEIFSQELEVSDYGTFDAKTIIDTKAPLGTYRIDAKGSSAYFDVEEYVPAPFKVETTTDKEEYISGDKLNMDIDASYYFGAPLQGGEVEYSIVSQNYYFDKYKDEYFNFGIPWYFCYEGCDYGNNFISRNTVSLNDSGKAQISYDLDLKKMFKDETNAKSKIIVFYVTVKNKNGQSVSAQKSFIVHSGEYYLGVKTDKYFFGKNENFEVKVKSVDTNGKNIPVSDISLRINKVSWAQSKRKEVDGGYYNRWERKLDLALEKKIGTDQAGNWKETLSLKEEGEYELTVSGLDGRSNAISGAYDVYVYGEAQVYVRRGNDESLELITEKNSLKVGEEAEIIIKSPYEKAKALISIERGKIFEYKMVDVNQNLYNYKFNVASEYVPNFFVSVILISSDPEVKFGKLDFQVGIEKKELNISAKSDKTEYLPGEDVVLDFESKDYQGNPAETEFSVAVVDLSVLALKGNPKKNPIVFFYGGFPLTVSTSSNIKNILYEVNVPGETKGGGGSGPEDLAKKKRGEFKDTAFWQAVVRTDSNGKARVKFTLPDNLTTWQVESVGITKDTKLGVGYGEFLSRKDIMAVPLKPRFVVPGDEFSLGAKIFNQTGERQNLEVSFSSESLAFKNDQSVKNISLGSKESKTVYFNLLADLYKQDGYHSFALSAKNSKFEDTVENVIKITRNDTYETTATSGYSKNSNVNEFVYLPDNITKDRGDLTIKSSATLAIFISDALNYLLSYPYGCSEQIASKLDSIAVVKRGLNIKNIGDKFELKNIEFDGNEYTVDEVVEIGLARLYQNQKSDGSFGYYPDSQSNIYLTLHVAGTLKSLKDAGYGVNEDVLSRAFALINNRLSYDTELQKNRDFVILAFDTLSKLSEYGKINNNLYNYIKSFSSDEAYLNEGISNTSLTTLAGILVEKEDVFGKYYKNKVFNILENRIDIDSRGAFLPPAKNITWQYYATPIKDTAMLLKVLVKDKRDNEILDRILRWILRSRSKDGAWGSTNNTLSAIDSLTDYINWQKENESNFDLTILLDGKEKQTASFNPETILSQNSLSIPVADLKFGLISNIEFEKKNNNQLNNNFYYDISLKYYLPIDQIPPRDEGFTITREFYRLNDKENKDPLSEASVGEVLRGQIKVLVPAQRNFVSVEDFIPAGAELVNFNLATEDQSLIAENKDYDESSYYWWNYYYDDNKLRPDMTEYRDDRLFLFKESLAQGEYEYDYYIRVLIPGTFHHLPAVVSEMYFPENFGRTSGEYFKVK